MKPAAAITRFIRALQDAPDRPDLFNPWWQVDPDHDLNERGPEIRRRQLAAYLQERVGHARFLLVGEALGYQGGHFSGIAMMSERILLGAMTQKGIHPHDGFGSISPERTSKPEIKPNGFTENTATIVWGHFAAFGLDPRRFVIWNACPWHPFQSKKGMLTNRTPTDAEVLAGGPLLRQLMELLSVRHLLAIGNKAHLLMHRLELDAEKVRHPACGGAPAFRAGFAEWVAARSK